MTVAASIERHEITELLHFTTNHGVLGMFLAGEILSRKQLPEQKKLENVYKPNSPVRKDPDWTGYISLSISRVNTRFFGQSRGWHQSTDTWWAIVAVDPAILCDDGVVFVTTNNIFPSRKRGTGESGLETLFAPSVAGLYGTQTVRAFDTPVSWTTDVAAEVLYPRPISTDHVRRVYVVNEHHGDLVSSQYDILRRSGDFADSRPELPIDVRPDLFA